MSDVKLTDYLPEVLSEAREMIAIENVLQSERENIYEELNIRINESYVNEAEESGVYRWEKILNITPMTTDTLEDRRFKLINRLNGDLPYTMTAIRKKLELICGKGNFKVTYNKEAFMLTVKLGLLIKKRVTEVRDMLYERIPANIILEVLLLYNNHEEVARFTHKKLSQWSHKEICEEVLE